MNLIKYLCVMVVVSSIALPGISLAKTYRVAYFASSSQNSFNQAVYEGVQEKASEIGNVNTDVFDGRFDAQVQYNQIEDAVASNKYDAFIIFASDTVGIASAVEEAISNDIKVVAAFFPIGPDLNSLNPQVKGLTATVGRAPAYGAKVQAEAIIKYCEDKDPCNVVVMVGQKIYPFDNLRYKVYLDEFNKIENINVIATVEGNYSPDISLAGMQDVLQSNKKIHAVVSNADQHIVGAEIALSDAGYTPSDVYLVGSGASKRGVAKIRQGAWDASLVMLPKTLGKLALETVVDDLKGKKVEKVVDLDSAVEFPSLLKASEIEKYPDFSGEWE